MTISTASNKLEELDYVKRAGAAPTDRGNIPCFQVVVKNINNLNDQSQREIEKIIRDNVRDVFNCEINVQSSPEYVEDEDMSVFWVYAYGVLGTISVGGIQYNIIEYNPDSFLKGVPTDYTNPMEGAETFKWSEVSITPNVRGDTPLPAD